MPEGTPPELKEAMKQESAAAQQQAPGKPYTTPKGYVPPTLGEQWRYAYMRHPQANWGYGAVFVCGLLAWAYTSSGSSEPAATANEPEPANREVTKR
mmetsp:Transcript_16919/g.50525  ORF Transcript_16919/g.50525 Transcript_16919/m.50525 type:complete len:97 (-) Transcript_16919:4085-4375(-)